MALHVAPMSHGVADTVRQPLKILGNILQHINRKWRTQSAAKSKIPSYFQSGGGGRTRTYEGIASGFTVRPLCRSGHSPENRCTALISKDNRLRLPGITVLC